jgi:transcriptional regulator with XRE-family HTH domain
MIKELLREDGGTVRELAADLGVSPDTINKWKRGVPPSLDHLDGLCTQFFVQPSTLFPLGKDLPYPPETHGASFPTALRELMLLHGVSNKRLAKQLNLAPRTIASWLAGKTTPNFNKFEELFMFFQVAPETFHQMHKFTRNIRYLLEEDLGLTPQQASKHLGVGQLRINGWLSGAWIPRADDLAHISHKLGVYPHTLMTDEIVWGPTQEFEHFRFELQVKHFSKKKPGVTKAVVGAPKHLTDWTIDRKYPTADILFQVVNFYGTTIDEYLGVDLANETTAADYLATPKKDLVE